MASDHCEQRQTRLQAAPPVVRNLALCRMETNRLMVFLSFFAPHQDATSDEATPYCLNVVVPCCCGCVVYFQTWCPPPQLPNTATETLRVPLLLWLPLLRRSPAIPVKIHRHVYRRIRWTCHRLIFRTGDSASCLHRAVQQNLLCSIGSRRFAFMRLQGNE
jgi:hypothetical protein